MKFIYVYFFLGAIFYSCSKNSSEDSSHKNIEDSIPKEISVNNSKINSSWENKIGALEENLIKSGLVNVAEEIPDVKVELKYSTTDNFFGEDVYDSLEDCYLQAEVVDMLSLALGSLQKKHPHLTFLIYDGVRPLSVQKHLWEQIDKPDSLKPLYVADPNKGSLHNYGVAVDLTLFDLKTGKPLDMGTPYDYFGYLAYPDKEEEMLNSGRLNKEQIQNRLILREAMKDAGFDIIGSEWWHFNAFSLEQAQKKYQIVK
ncbi:M15 family metallopeptidase [Echinicola jeungdonensis]|uniref:D-alanyl-D-alanine dipeptidase n=1 Tax=Echinicola jeungdonensis TaxID=709343 RepID=A0ABV5J5T7_9BACT|nr:M15 family metallopeptidase [Echinicola jeungdonensis]MDN3669576.1 M15 family metallopeptidase [Echinicola jeungdonensis]